MSTSSSLGIFWHKCTNPDCNHMVEFDDEPACFKHSPDSGSFLRGYSARELAMKNAVKNESPDPEKRYYCLNCQKELKTDNGGVFWIHTETGFVTCEYRATPSDIEVGGR